MDRTAVTSSSLAGVAYDAARRTLEVEFRTGKVYRYFDVPPRVHEELMAADSHGRYFNHRVRDVYRYVRV